MFVCVKEPEAEMLGVKVKQNDGVPKAGTRGRGGSRQPVTLQKDHLSHQLDGSSGRGESGSLKYSHEQRGLRDTAGFVDPPGGYTEV